MSNEAEENCLEGSLEDEEDEDEELDDDEGRKTSSDLSFLTARLISLG
jgi:hypothetical protein